MKTLGLVLGSGGARGLAHIGVLRALDDANIPVSHIAGASIGALVGAIYVANELDDFEAYVCGLNWRAIVTHFDIVFPSNGLLDGNRVYDLLSDHLKEIAIEDSDIEFCCIATDLLRGQEVRMQKGPMVDAVRASIAIPGVFTPFVKDQQCLGDGGIINPLPVDVMRDMGADVVIAVNLNSNPESTSTADGQGPTSSAQLPNGSPDVSPSSPSLANQPLLDNADNLLLDSDALSLFEVNIPDNPRLSSRQHGVPNSVDLRSNLSLVQNRVSSLWKHMQARYETVQDQLQEKVDNWIPEQKRGMNIFDVIGISLNIMEQQVAKSKLKACPPEILIEPALADYGIFDFHQADLIIDEGYRCMEKLIPELRKQLLD